MTGRPSYVYVTYIESSPERVWEVLTDPDLTGQYWGHSNVSDWQAGSRDIRAALLRREDLDRLRKDHPYGVLAATSPGPSGRFRYYVRDPGDYAVVLDNRDSDQPATIRLRVWLDFAGPPGYDGQSLSPQRRLGVILVSFAIFFGIVTWSARRLLQNVRK